MTCLPPPPQSKVVTPAAGMRDTLPKCHGPLSASALARLSASLTQAHRRSRATLCGSCVMGLWHRSAPRVNKSTLWCH